MTLFFKIAPPKNFCAHLTILSIICENLQVCTPFGLGGVCDMTDTHRQTGLCYYNIDKYCFRECWGICWCSYVKKTRSTRVNTSLMVMTGFSHNIDLDNYAISSKKYFSLTILQKWLNIMPFYNTKPLSHTKFYFTQSHCIYVWTMMPFRHRKFFIEYVTTMDEFHVFIRPNLLVTQKIYFRQSHSL